MKEIITEIANEYRLFNKRWIEVKKKILENQEEIKNLDITFDKIQTKQTKLDEFDLDDVNEKA